MSGMSCCLADLAEISGNGRNGFSASLLKTMSPTWSVVGSTSGARPNGMIGFMLPGGGASWMVWNA